MRSQSKKESLDRHHDSIIQILLTSCLTICLGQRKYPANNFPPIHVDYGVSQVPLLLNLFVIVKVRIKDNPLDRFRARLETTRSKPAVVVLLRQNRAYGAILANLQPHVPDEPFVALCKSYRLAQIVSQFQQALVRDDGLFAIGKWQQGDEVRDSSRHRSLYISCQS